MAVGSSAADRAEPRRAHAFLAVQALGILSLATNSRWRNTNLDQDSLADNGAHGRDCGAAFSASARSYPHRGTS
jgi:hypothetical protein